MGDTLLKSIRADEPKAPERPHPARYPVSPGPQTPLPRVEPEEAPPSLLPAQERAWAASRQRILGNQATAEMLSQQRQGGVGAAAHFGGGSSSKIRMTRGAPDLSPAEIADASFNRALAPKSKTPVSAPTTAATGAEGVISNEHVRIRRPNRHSPVVAVSDSEYIARYREDAEAGAARAEGGLPKAFLSVRDDIPALNITTPDRATLDTNVRVSIRPGNKGGGEVWLEEAELSWTLITAGYINMARTDESMLRSYDAHERGHRTINEALMDRLARLLCDELERALPTAARPLRIGGAAWEQRGVEQIGKKIQQILARYRDQWRSLSEEADGAWDTQEKASLSRLYNEHIQKSRQRGPGNAAPGNDGP